MPNLASNVVLRATCVTFSAWLGAVAPTEFVARGQRAANLAAKYTPNMDPGAMVTLTTMLAVPALTLALLAELARCWAMNGKPLASLSYVALGTSVACPIGYAFAIPGARVGYVSLLLLSGLALALFYVVRQAWLSAAARRARARSGAA